MGCDYMSFLDGIEVVHTQNLNEDTNITVEVHFERSTSNRFDFAKSVPNLFAIEGYQIYFWSNENNEPIHVHITDKVEFYCL